MLKDYPPQALLKFTAFLSLIMKNWKWRTAAINILIFAKNFKVILHEIMLVLFLNSHDTDQDFFRIRKNPEVSCSQTRHESSRVSDPVFSCLGLFFVARKTRCPMSTKRGVTRDRHFLILPELPRTKAYCIRAQSTIELRI